ncbi:membrane-associated protein [Marinobacter orientalis]|uniref:Membrane-associated protein n=1 Tax=Marinobacter orientalis TaxID=1928859 RepID=A0A7Y0WTJ4_9GAMM|nr:membrane-associated protein [Marinobacter orientalis]NMT65048.1 membrane-associated protein [Marinobacter orientalis]TGX49003.1 membrane-associated protein [Marinobacter orientalis]
MHNQPLLPQSGFMMAFPKVIRYQFTQLVCTQSRFTMRIPLWIKMSYTLLVMVIIPVYWRDLGPANFLWFSDIALILLVPALWLENRLISSTMAVGVLFLESVWVLDFISGGNIIRIAAYMFDPELETHIRILSGLFHLVLPPLLFYLLYRLGYDRRALALQMLIAAVTLPITYLVTEPESNINWVYGLAEPQQILPPLLYLVLLFLALTVCIYLPSHWLFKRFFSHRRNNQGVGVRPAQQH